MSPQFDGEERELHLRVKAEFREMPGLKVTLPQAARLFGIEQVRCSRVLGALVHAGVLVTDGKIFTRMGGSVALRTRAGVTSPTAA